jgi:hypothetical protein
MPEPNKAQTLWSSYISKSLNLLPLISQTYCYPALGLGFPKGIQLLLNSWHHSMKGLLE